MRPAKKFLMYCPSQISGGMLAYVLRNYGHKLTVVESIVEVEDAMWKGGFDGGIVLYTALPEICEMAVRLMSQGMKTLLVERAEGYGETVAHHALKPGCTNADVVVKVKALGVHRRGPQPKPPRSAEDDQEVNRMMRLAARAGERLYA